MVVGEGVWPGAWGGGVKNFKNIFLLQNFKKSSKIQKKYFKNIYILVKGCGQGRRGGMRGGGGGKKNQKYFLLQHFKKSPNFNFLPNLRANVQSHES